MEWANIRGFNYQPSYGSCGLELWDRFDAETIHRELDRGKRYFPKINAIRWWLSWDSFIRGPALFEDRFQKTLDVADSFDLKVMPVLFNRWHDFALDYGGIYIDHLICREDPRTLHRMFDPFLERIVGGHADDGRIIAWDLCNEPFSYARPEDDIEDIVQAEFKWLEHLYHTCKRLDAAAPVTVGVHGGTDRKGLLRISKISDVLSIHPYWMADSPPHRKSDFEHQLDEYVSVSREVNKPLVATETCWGSTDDAKRAEIIQYTLGQLKKRGIGWFAYVLHHSLIADAHRSEFGILTAPGNLSFIEADGSLRPGHEVFNEF
jgi:endo-1,4-beta-mannosidase